MPPPPPPTVAALSLGPEAAALRQAPAPGHVLAVLRTAVYLEAGDGAILGLVGADAPDGPLTLRVPDLNPVLQCLRDHQNAPFRATCTSLEIDASIYIAWAHTTAWTPALPAVIAPPAARAAAARALAAELAPRKAAVQLPDFGGSETDDPKSKIQNLNSKIVGLLGLGPGLTPSGDDVLMGLLAALYWQARLGALPPEPVAALAAAVLAAAPTQTTRLSTRLLAHAAEGILYAPALALGTALLAGDPAAVPAPARHLFTIGHTSGADMAHGLLIGTLLGT